MKFNNTQKTILKIGVLFFICFGFIFLSILNDEHSHYSYYLIRVPQIVLLIIFQMILWVYVWRTNDNHSILRTVLTIFFGFIIVDHISNLILDLINYGGFYYHPLSKPIDYLTFLFKPSILNPPKLFNFVIILYSLITLYKLRKTN